MIRIAATANEQYLALIDYYLERERPEAAEKLTEAVEQAARQIEANPRIGRNFPAIYDTFIWPGVRWLKVHRYWFSYTSVNEPVIFNILWEAADIPGRAMPPEAASEDH
jgi:plasmid stabilization system protein ParE